jgi:hypothetical protein
MVARTVKSFLSAVRFPVIIAFLTSVAPAGAPYFWFMVPTETVEVIINEDSSLDIDYETVFYNDPSADPIDIIDVGFPSNDYDLSSVTAELNGTPVTDIRVSEYISVGVEIHLDTDPYIPIYAGETAVLHVRGRNYHRVYEDDDDESYASVVFGTNYFGNEYCYGVKDLTIRVVFPPGVTGDMTRYHKSKAVPTGMYVRDDARVVYEYRIPDASPSQMYTVGVSFPRDFVAEVKPPPRFEWLGAILGFFIIIIEYAMSFIGCLFPIGIFILIGVIGSISRRRRRMKYLPPLAKVEGVGIKRGLAAPEAALLLEKPLDRVLTMVMFGLMKKGALALVSEEPLKLKPQVISANGLRKYENAFLETIESDGDLDQSKLQDVIVDMIDGLENKMKGFSYSETVEYYRSIVNTAWRLVTEAATPELKAEEFSNSLEWTMLDDDFDGRTNDIFGGVTYVPTPAWWVYATPSAPAAGVAAPSVGEISLPQLPGSGFAHGIISKVEGISSGIVGKVESFTGKVTAVTNPPPVSRGGGLGGGGGSGCACACACAGCACACAGGGR